MTELGTDVSFENTEEEEDGDIQPSSSHASDPVPVNENRDQDIIDCQADIDIETLEVFNDDDIPKTNEEVEVVTQSNIIDSESTLNYDPNDIITDFDDDIVDLVEIDVHTTESDSNSPKPMETANSNVEDIKIEEMDISGTPLEGTTDGSDTKEVSEKRGIKRKGICLDDEESFANSFEGMYTCDTVVGNSKNEDHKVNESRNNSRLLDSQIQCVNMHCQSGYGLEVAPVFVLTYFGQQRKKNILQKVCQQCFKMAFRHQQDVVYRLKAHKSVLKASFPPLKSDVVDMDPVEEEYEEEPLSDEVMSQIRKYLPELLVETMQKYDLDFQLHQANRILDKKFQRLEDKGKLINDELNSLEKTMRESRLLIYKDFTPKIRTLPSLTIMEPILTPDIGLPDIGLPDIGLPGIGLPGIGLQDIGLQDINLPDIGLPDIGNGKKINFTENESPVCESEGESSSSQDIVAVEEVEVPKKKLPPTGPLVYPLLGVGDTVYVMKANLFSLWVKGKITEVINENPEIPAYRVRIETSQRGGVNKLVSGKYLAYSKPSPVRYPVGTRIIALFKTLEAPSKSAFYAGLIAEPPKHLNRFRYLVFFDDGYAYYVPHEKIHLVCESSQCVFEDIHPESREFIKKYLERYPERPMVKLLQGQIVRTEWKGKWWLARVMELDCSLAKMRFDADGRTEWIYRGSTRLGPLYSELVVGTTRKVINSSSKRRSMGSSSHKKRTLPCIEYSVDREEPKGSHSSGKHGKKKSSSKTSSQEPPKDQKAGSPRTSGRMEYMTRGYIRSIDLSRKVTGKAFVPHQCGPACTEWTKYSVTDCRGMNPLALPLFFGFERQSIKHKGKRNIMYRAPCGRRLRTMVEIHRYLRITKTSMGVEFFDFDNSIRVLDEFFLDSDMYQIFLKDVSYGLEKNPVTCVNEIDHTWPTFMDYSTLRIPQEDVKICFDEEFLVNCDCDDDCQDKTKCDCWKLTIEGTKSGAKKVPDSSVGYKFKRLLEPVTTGIYECNHKCKCAATCLNRVAQRPFQLNLQVFKTLKKGWGLRAINDIPQGGFICIYAGRLHTERGANVDGSTHGDEYMAELDYIEVVEKFKEGYESDVVEPVEPAEPAEKIDEEEEGKDKKLKTDDQDYISEGLGKLPQTQGVGSTRARRRRVSMKQKLDGENTKEKEKKSLRPVSEAERRKRSVRVMYGDGPDEVYVMDAKSIGNIGRYLNHSCQPNVFVQNVFVDSHDLRFPWVAFFALTQIKAGTELTWDYNYEVGSVENKVLHCYCNKAECRGRLL